MALSPELARLLAQCEAAQASDVHLACGQIPRFRMQGQLVPHPAFAALDEARVDAIAMELGLETLPRGCADGTERIRLALLREGALDGAVTSSAGARYRFNIYRDGGRTAVALRRLDGTFRTLAQLGLPARLEDFCWMTDGLVVVTGPTGSGKSTTLATLIDTINRTHEGFIITIEDPIEFVHESQQCLVNQRQVGRDARGFNEALVEAMRQDPDVILVGEIRDLETIRTAIRAAETGHLLLSSLHTIGTAKTIDRILPPIGNLRIVRQWAGLYTMTPDRQPVYDKSEKVEGLYFAIGFSGHGFMFGPITGIVMRDIILGNEPVLDVSRLKRFETGDLFIEPSVV